MTKDELYPIIDEVLHERYDPYTNAGSAWIEFRDYGEVQLRIHELAEALCDAIVERMAGAPVVSGDDRMYTPDEWVPPHDAPPHDHKGHSEEKCVRYQTPDPAGM